MIHYCSEVSDQLLACTAAELHRYLAGPTVFHIAGERNPPLFLSTLQHGNEDSGWEALRELLQSWRGRPLPRSLVLFVANVEAARFGLRRLDHQPDFNRCWPGAAAGATTIHRALAELTAQMRAAGVFISVDIHNNSGRNPHYAAITRLRPQWLYLARLFERQAVYYQHPTGTQADAFSAFCTAITVECGKAGNAEAVPHCRDFLERLLRLEQLPTQFDSGKDLRLYQTVARATVAPGLEFGFGKGAQDIDFVGDIETLNFQQLATGTVLAQLHGARAAAVHAVDSEGEDVTGRYLAVDPAGRLVVQRPFTPAMLSTDPRIVRQDCLCYIMERLEPGRQQPATGR